MKIETRSGRLPRLYFKMIRPWRLLVEISRYGDEDVSLSLSKIKDEDGLR